MDLLTAAGTYFSEDYREARRRFLAACEKAGVAPKSYKNPHQGPHGEELATDVAWFGPEDARKVLVMVSSTHGVEGFPGSAGQCDWIENGRLAEGHGALPDGVAVLVVHAVNPYGFAWLRRVTEEGVDLNRNWVDFGEPLPENPGYEELHDALVPRSLDEATLEAADRTVQAYRDRHGDIELQVARSGGQYTRPGGVFFGGREPTWSRRTLERILQDYRLAERDLVAVVDYHTGLGPFGYGEPIADHTPGSINVRRALAWYGESVTQPRLGTSSSVPKTGLAEYGWERMLGEKVTFIALEYGTYASPRGMKVLRQDHWLHNETNVDWNDPATKRIKAEIRAHFAPQMLDWQEMVLFRSRQIQRQALSGLAAA